MTVREGQGLVWSNQPLQQHQQGFGDAGETGEGTVSEDSGGQDSEGEQSPYASQFLSNIPDADRSVVEKYVKQWDSGVSRRFQDIHSQYAPYKELGWEGEILDQVKEVIRVLNEEPETLYRLLHEEYGSKEAAKLAQSLGEELDSASQGNLSPEYAQRLDQMQQAVELMAQRFLDDDKSVQEAKYEEELDSELNSLREELGDFDEEYVLMKIANGADPEQAVMAWHGLVQEKINAAGQSTSRLIPTLSSQGGGAIPQEVQDLSRAPSKDIRGLVADILGKVNRG